MNEEIPLKAQKEKNEQIEIARKKKICVFLKIGEFKGQPLVCSVNVNPKMLTSQLCEHFCLKNPDIVHPGKSLQLYLEDRILPNEFTLEYNLIHDQFMLTGVWKEEEKKKVKKKGKMEFRCRIWYQDREISFEYSCRLTTNISTMIKNICEFLKIEERRKMNLLWRGEICIKTNQIKDYSFEDHDLFELVESFPIYIHSDKYPDTLIFVNPYMDMIDVVQSFKLLNQIECKNIIFSKDGYLLDNKKKIGDYDIKKNDIIYIHRIQLDPFSLLKTKQKESSPFASSVMFNAPDPKTIPPPPLDFL